MSLVLAAVLSGCEKEVDVIPRDTPPVLVVEATIENGRPPLVILSNSFQFFDSLGLVDLEKSFIKGAEVTISNGQRTVRLEEYEEDLLDRKWTYYTISRTNPGQAMIGTLKTAYSLNIVTSGKSYSAQTFIPDTSRRIIDIWWKQGLNEKDSSLVNVFVKITDPPGLGNYIRWFTSVNDSAFLPGFGSVVDDALIDGTTYDVQIFRSYSRNADIDSETFGYFRRGEKASVKLSNIDKGTFDFWRTWEQNASNQGNPFGTPVKILTNIKGGATGYFAGYASQIKTIRIPD